MIEEQAIYCPYCGERQTVLVDLSQGSASYIEDCQVCCRPIVFQLVVDYEGEYSLNVAHEDDVGY
jgi:transcription elongation factor Elf1